jgi:hypothetical protein
MKPLSKIHQEAIAKARTDADKNKAAALAMIEKPIEMIKAIMLKHELAVIEVMRELHESREAAVRAEREACAKVCDDIELRCIAKDVDDPPLKHVAAAIRARGEQALAQPEQDGDCKKCKDGCPACDARKLQKEAHDLL